MLPEDPVENEARHPVAASALYVKTQSASIGTFSFVELREALLAGVIASDAVFSTMPSGPWKTADEIGLTEKGGKACVLQDLPAPMLHVDGLQANLHGPFKLREVIDFAASRLLPIQARVAIASGKDAPDPAPGDWMATSQTRILNEIFRGSLLLLSENDQRILLTSTTITPEEISLGRPPGELAPQLNDWSSDAGVRREAEVDPDDEAEQMLISGKAIEHAWRSNEKRLERAAKQQASNEPKRDASRPMNEDKKRRRRRPIAGAIVAVSLLAITILALLAFQRPGRHKGLPSPVPVEVTVTLNGLPLADATITFASKAVTNLRAGGIATGITDEKGQPEMLTQAATSTVLTGVVPGEYAVLLSKFVPPNGLTQSEYQRLREKQLALEESGELPTEPVGAKVQLLKPEYGRKATTPLSATVTAEGPNRFTFDVSMADAKGP